MHNDQARRTALHGRLSVWFTVGGAAAAAAVLLCVLTGRAEDACLSRLPGSHHEDLAVLEVNIATIHREKGGTTEGGREGGGTRTAARRGELVTQQERAGNSGGLEGRARQEERVRNKRGERAGHTRDSARARCVQEARQSSRESHGNDSMQQRHSDRHHNSECMRQNSDRACD